MTDLSVRLDSGEQRGPSSENRVRNGPEMSEIAKNGGGTVAGQPPTSWDGTAALRAVWERGGDGAGRRGRLLMDGTGGGARWEQGLMGARRTPSSLRALSGFCALSLHSKCQILYGGNLRCTLVSSNPKNAQRGNLLLTLAGIMHFCNYYFTRPIPARLGFVACAPIAVLLTLLSLVSIVPPDVDIKLFVHASTDEDGLVAANNSTVVSHLYTRNIQTRDAVGDGSNDLSNVLLITFLVLFSTFLLLVAIALSCCRCRNRKSFVLFKPSQAFHDILLGTYRNLCRRRNRRRRNGKEKTKDLEMQPLVSENDASARETEHESASNEEQ
ncbi:hypothetical protein SCHPADRAFT_1002341 [Schizopora paradoxa]|uniref:Uncharacterized protein n=1 Tax=Schizopora paradoxa TaxID=27342 RepID=A0A0H2RNR4_9AGAM|nr:hypothetical protein SCHPADRAFT_1002341 [Schizopora paradoxa]